MFSVNLTPWHREGHVLTEAPTFEEALKLAGHDYTVEVRPTFRQIVTGEFTRQDGTKAVQTDYVENRDAKVTVRTDTQKELGAVGGWYTPIQNRDAFGVLCPLIDQGIAAPETGGTLRDGADAWMLVKFDIERFGPTVREVFGDELVPFGLIANNHSGRRGVLLQLTPIRVVCANTLGMTEARGGVGNADEGESVDGRTIVVRHTASVEAKVTEAAERLFKGVLDRYEVIAQQYKLLKATHLDTALFRELVIKTAAPDPRDNPKFNPEAMMAKSVVERWEKKAATLTRLWTEGKGHTGDQSAWEAYNAVVEAVDHDVDGLWPLRGGVYRTQALLQGEYGRTKDRVLTKVVAHAAGR